MSALPKVPPSGMPDGESPQDGQPDSEDAPSPIRRRLKTPFEMFEVLLAKGYWPILIYPKGAYLGPDRISEGKNPIEGKWGLVRWTVDKANRIIGKWPGAGVGICLGPGRAPGERWLIDVEGDGPEAEESRSKLYGGEVVESLGWGSTRGGHQLLTCEVERLARIMPALKEMEQKGATGTGVYKFPELPGLELRIGGYKADKIVKQTQSVVPPTIGTNGQPRLWNGFKVVATAPDSFYKVLESLTSKKPSAKGRPSRNSRPSDFKLSFPGESICHAAKLSSLSAAA